MDNQKFTMEEFAIKIGCSRNSLYRWDKDGSFPARRTPGGQPFYTQADLDKFFNNTKGEPLNV